MTTPEDPVTETTRPTREQVVADLQRLALQMLAGEAAMCRCGKLIEQEECGAWSTPDGDVWCSADELHAPAPPW